MDKLGNASLGARRNEDIALDLSKFVAGTVGIRRWPKALLQASADRRPASRGTR